MNKYEELKARAQLFKAGSIVPRRMIKCTKRKFQHLLKFANDTYTIPGPHGYVAFTEVANKGYCCNIKTTLALDFNGSPYHKRDMSFRRFVWYNKGDDAEAFQARVVEALQPSQIRWVDNSEHCPNE